MKFLNPAGLWLLLGIPVLIIIYLIKSQHEDTSVSSTYIWRLSSKFMKKKLPMQKLKKILIFILQLLMIICAALMVSRPAIDNGSSRDYILILDASASMNIADENGETRFKRAVDQIEEMTDVINQGHQLTVIVAADEAYYAVRESSSVSETKIELGKLQCSMGSCNIEDAMTLAQNICDFSDQPEVIFYTDADPAETENITVINLNQNEWNVSIEDVKAVKKGSDTVFNVDLTSYNKDADVAVGLNVDGKIVSADIAQCTAGEKETVSITAEGITSYDIAEVYIDEDDGLAEDNTYSVCPKKSGTYKVLLVSTSPLYLESALEALGNCELTVSSTVTGITKSDFDIIVYDRVYTKNYPDTVSVIQFGTKLLPDGLTAGSTVEEEGNILLVNGADETLYENVTMDDSVVSEYTELIGNETWEPFLAVDNTVIGMTSQTDGGAQITVIGFDLHDSNLPLKTDFTALIHNLIEYSAPYPVKKTDFSVGESVRVTAVHNAESLYIMLPDDSVKQLALPEDMNYTEYVPEYPGVYTAALTMEEGGEYADFFVHIPDGEIEGNTDAVLKIAKAVSGNLSAEDETEAMNEIWMYLAAAILLLLMAEWGVYYYEQR